MKRVLVAGATGYLGRFVVEELKREGYWVRALSRSESKLEPISEHVDEAFIGEVTKSDTLAGVCDGIDVVFSAVGITQQKDKLSYMGVDYRGNVNLLDEAKRSGVGKFLYVSVFNSRRLQHLKMVKAKICFENRLKESGLAYTILRPNGFFSDMCQFLKMAREETGYVFGNGLQQANPIHGADLAEICVNAISKDEAEIDVGGPDVLTQNQILRYAFAAVGKEEEIRRVPPWVKNRLLTTLRLFKSPKSYGPLEFLITVRSMDMVAPSYGTHHLEEFFAETAAIV